MNFCDAQNCPIFYWLVWSLINCCATLGYSCKSLFTHNKYKSLKQINKPNWIASTRRIKTPVTKTLNPLLSNNCSDGNYGSFFYVTCEAKRIFASRDVGMYICWPESQIILFKVTKLYIYTVLRLDKICFMRNFELGLSIYQRVLHKNII